MTAEILLEPLREEPNQPEILRQLEPVVKVNLDRHLAIPDRLWSPHDYVPYDEGRNYAALGGEDWSPEQSRLSPAARAAMVLNLLTEDNLPSYHRVIAELFGLDSAWGKWVGTWTAEENRHAIVMREYLNVTRGVDPEALEAARMNQVTAGYRADKDPLHALAYVTFQELATRVSHRNTGKACNDPIADRMLARVAKDENQHMLFYSNLVQAALEIAPNQTMGAITDEVAKFRMPGSGMENFQKMATLIADAGIYDPSLHLKKVVLPALRKWKVFEISGLSAEGEQARERLEKILGRKSILAERFTEERDSRASPDTIAI